MRVWVLLFALAALAAGDGFNPLVPPGVQTNADVAVLFDGMTPCYNFIYGEAGPDKLRIDAACDGPFLAMSCHLQGELTYRVAAGANRSAIFAGDIIENNVRFLYRTDLGNNSLLAFRDSASDPIASCFSANLTTDVCWNLQENASYVVAMGICAGILSSGDVITRQIYASPCANKVLGDPCVAPGFGAAAPGWTCDAVGNCTGAPPAPCLPDTDCRTFAGYNPITGDCEYELLDGDACNSTDYCILDALCVVGVCVPGTTMRQCNLLPCTINGTCNSTSEQCDYIDLPLGTPCSTGLFCVENSTCTAPQTCSGTTITNITDLTCRKNCTCNPANGQPLCDIAFDGTFCNNGFGSQCMIAGECMAGDCEPTVFVDCITPVGCLGAGVCDDVLGTCQNRTKLPLGTPCDDGNSCTVTECNGNGGCLVVNQTTCPPSSSCFLPGFSNGTGPTCVCNNNYFNGGTCSVFGPCQPGTCGNGTCISVGPPTICPGDQCNFPTSCSPVTGCLNPRPPDTPCEAPNGCPSTCLNGACSNPTICAKAPDLEWAIPITTDYLLDYIAAA